MTTIEEKEENLSQIWSFVFVMFHNIPVKLFISSQIQNNNEFLFKEKKK